MTTRNPAEFLQAQLKLHPQLQLLTCFRMAVMDAKQDPSCKKVAISRFSCEADKLQVMAPGFLEELRRVFD